MCKRGNRLVRSAGLIAVLLWGSMSGCGELAVPALGMTDMVVTVQHYEYAVDLDSGTAHSNLQLLSEASGGHCLELHNQSQIRSATINGQPAAFGMVSPSIYRFCGEPSAEKTLVLQTEQQLVEGTVVGTHGGYFRAAEPGRGRFIYLSNWVADCARLGPCDPRPDQLSSISVAVTHRADEVVLCPGTRYTQSQTTRCEIRGPLAPLYSGFGVLARTGWQRVELASTTTAKVSLFETPEKRLSPFLPADEVARFLTWIQDLLGPLPYGTELRVAAAPITWLGFEHPANIVLREDLEADHRVFAHPTLHVLMHEIVHQWAGNRTTLVDTLDFAWKEAIAEYLTFVYERAQRPLAESEQTRRSWRLLSLFSLTYPRPLALPGELLGLASDAYATGPMLMFLQLEPIVGQAAIIAAIQEFLKEPGFRSVRDLQSALERNSGRKLDDYFAAWVYGSGLPAWPTFAALSQQAADKLTIEIKQQPGEGRGDKTFPAVLSVRVYGAQSVANALVPVGMAAEARSTISFADTVQSLLLDPDELIVHWSR